MEAVYIISAVRTPIGSFGGILSSLSATDLGGQAIKGALKAAAVSPDMVQEVLMGNVVSANLGQAPARQAALAAGIPDTVPCTTVNKVCSSGLKSVMFGAQSIQLGQADIILAGGMECMSQIPFYVPKARFGYKYGTAKFVDGLERDGLQDVYDQCAMGNFADQTAAKYQISRDEQDAYAIQSYERSAMATESGGFLQEIVPVEVPQRKGEALTVKEDEEFRRVNFEKVSKLRPAFNKDGTVTAANASTINDGASAIVLASESAVKKYDLKPIARIVSYADAAHSPSLFTTAPTEASPIALSRAGFTKNDIDYFEVNEAFAVVPLVYAQLTEIDASRMNVHGGAVSLGHPLGASGARILTTLTHVLAEKSGRFGLAAICNGGGGASAMIIERIP